MSRPPRPRPRGFTLIELVVALALLGLLAMTALPLAELTRQRSQETELRRALRDLRGALDAWRAAVEAGQIARAPGQSPWPPDLQVLVDGVADQRSPGGGRLVFLRRLPRDPFADPTLPAEATWRLRASDSPAADPRPGRDVFDVRSSSPRVAIDGSLYASW
ncbi:prepilin-type N-terminal cleavage/methylation domain-containing protein [Pseudaquabacterium pictum]|uniref:Type II secretion system pseudopilin PulG n=1 Tax=Pseudaquabacterium pictum TaxID=2315236 RepID=A0A480APW5_9BURK|nr:prepilin-type N-terminal cleavage/methylation domain-containing protein [Rubrivivax pictus]GCL63463.1 hypothetical protein AQPW35_25440 [Rubrivivax pictus]